MNSIGPGVPGGQSNAANMNPPNQIDPSSIERAYAALGLTYQGNQVPQQPSQANMPNQGGLQGQPAMRNLNTMGQFETPPCSFFLSVNAYFLMPTSPDVIFLTRWKLHGSERRRRCAASKPAVQPAAECLDARQYQCAEVGRQDN